MSVYSVKGKGWRYDFELEKKRYSGQWYKTKKAARETESDRRKEVLKPEPQIPTDMGFLELVNRRLDHVKAYNSEKHYSEYKYMAKRWIRQWGKLKCIDIARDMVQDSS